MNNEGISLTVNVKKLSPLDDKHLTWKTINQVGNKEILDNTIKALAELYSANNYNKLGVDTYQILLNNYLVTLEYK